MMLLLHDVLFVKPLKVKLIEPSRHSPAPICHHGSSVALAVCTSTSAPQAMTPGMLTPERTLPYIWYTAPFDVAGSLGSHWPSMSPLPVRAAALKRQLFQFRSTPTADAIVA